MSRAYGLGPAVRGTSVACPECKRRKGLPSARKAALADVRAFGHLGVKLGEWIGESKKCHPARITAAIEARQARERGAP